jgi:aryl-alcohol dehydrogenase-like predicted oxidoreductase/enamine deaminase RidA (YjgF/YER057c/UK114 family)
MHKQIERVELAPGFSISRVLTGLWQIADMERDDREFDQHAAVNAMRPYVDAGFTTFDMADHYGSAEIIAGEFAKTSETEIQLLTKWVPKPGSNTKEDVRAAVQRALDRLQTDQIDLLQFHAWNYADPIWLDCLFWLQELKKEGLICHLGLTNVDTAHLRVIVKSGVEIVSNQVCFSLLDQRAQHGMTQFCLENNIKILAFGTVAGGFLTEKWLGKSEPKQENLPTWSQNKYKRFIDVAGGWDVYQDLLKTLDKIAKKHDVSIANVACRSILDNPAVGGIIIGARLGKSEHIRDNLKLFEFALANNERDTIKEILQAFAPIPGDCGDEYRKPPFLTASGDLSHHLESMPNPFEICTGTGGNQRVFTGTIWEDIAGFCRAIRHENRILISGTTATHGDKRIGGDDPAAQLHFVIDKIEGALQSFNAGLENVIFARMYIKNLDDWEILARVHGERFAGIQPANTMIQAGIIGDGYLVEMEVEAVVKQKKKSNS